MHPTLYRLLLGVGVLVLIGGAGLIAAEAGLLAKLGVGPSVTVGQVHAEAASPRDSAAPAFEVTVVESAGGTRPRLVLDVRNASDSAIGRLYALASFRMGRRSVITSHPVPVAGGELGPLAAGGTRRVLLQATRRFRIEPAWYGGPFITADVFVSRDRAALGRRESEAQGMKGIEVGQP